MPFFPCLSARDLDALRTCVGIAKTVLQNTATRALEVGDEILLLHLDSVADSLAAAVFALSDAPELHS